MATQDFGLSFTVSAPALWVDYQQGKLGESSNILAEVLSFEKLGEASSIFADIIVLDKLGESTSISASGLCSLRNILAGPGLNTLGGPLTSVLNCT